MFILGDETPNNWRIPWVTGGLILVNVLVFVAQKGLGEKFTYGYSLVPAEIVTGKDLVKPQEMKIKVPYRNYRGRTQYRETWVSVPQYPGPRPIYLTLLTSMFLHANWFHLIGNMWFLGVFGRNVETALNHGRFLLYYLLCGVAGGLLHVVSAPQSVIPCLGASGAISGVMGSYLAIYPFNNIKIWFGFYFGVLNVPAIVVLGIWFAWQYVAAFASAELGSVGGGVAYWDHLGGFLAGLALIFGTIAYLKWQLANAPPPSEEEAAPAIAPADPLPDRPQAEDPFANFLPANSQASATPTSPANPGDLAYLPTRR